MTALLRIKLRALQLLAAALTLFSPSAQALLAGTAQIEASLVAERTAIMPGESLRIGLRLNHAPGWHTYWRNPGDSGLPTTVQLASPSGWQVGEIEWPTPRRFAVGPLANHGYDGEVLLPFRMKPPAGLTADTVTLRIKAAWLACKDVCVPGEANLSLALPVLPSSLPSSHAALFARADADMPDSAGPAEATAYLDAKELVLAMKAAPPRRAELFSFEPGLAGNAAAHRVYRLDDGWQLRIARPEFDALEPARASRVAGVLVVDGTAVTVDAPVLGAPLAAPAEMLASVLPIGSADAAERSGVKTTPGTSRPGAPGFWTAVGLAFVGGLLLNLMPCVFPVIGLKVLSLVRSSNTQLAAGQQVKWTAAYALGVLVTFWVLAAAVLLLRSSGESVGWGFQLQSPSFVAAMALLFFLIGLSLMEVFPVTGPSLSDPSGSAGPGVRASFSSGVLGTLVATPCTAPFMGAAVGFALGQSAAAAFAVFTALGVGLALPVVLLAAMPGALAWLPRPGAWMQTLRHWMAFPMFASTLWLMWVLVRQTDASSVLSLGGGLLLVAAGAWTYGRYRQAPPAHAKRHRLAGAFMLTMLGLGIGIPGITAGLFEAVPLSATATSIQWERYSAARLQALRADNRPVLIEFTADWCVVCQVNQTLVLERNETVRLLTKHRVALLRADWTRRDPEVTDALAALGRNGVPVYAFYAPGRSAAQLLPEALTPSVIRKAVAPSQNDAAPD